MGWGFSSKRGKKEGARRPQVGPLRRAHLPAILAVHQVVGEPHLPDLGKEPEHREGQWGEPAAFLVFLWHKREEMVLLKPFPNLQGFMVLRLIFFF